ncbi:ATP-binding protein [Pseudoxanthomonas suwonensis]|uniref:ATP-binding protein n=1 Tax=Pseudoxanthomonas suwonensis TaxID=314722 RepID=UPI000AE95ED8|nr:ATP-binding protein [Pseudoxanthomonas suwonensis]
MTRLDGPRLPQAPAAGPATEGRAADCLAWTGVLVAELDRRAALLVEELRDGGGIALRSLVVTDAEVDAMLASGRAGHGDGFVPGSLAGSLQDPAGTLPWRLSALQHSFGLGAFELDALLVCLAPEIDRRFERLFAYLNDDMAKPRPSTDTLLRMLAARHEHVHLQACLMADATLLRHGLLASDGGDRVAQVGLFRVADGIVRHLLGRGGSDPRVARVLLDEEAPLLLHRLWRARDERAVLAALLEARTAAAAEDAAPVPLVANLHGRDGSGRADAVRSACRQAGIGCLSLDGRELGRCAADLHATLAAALRDARLAGSVVFIHHSDRLLDEPERRSECCAMLRAWLREFGGVLLLGSEAPLPFPGWFPSAETADIAFPLPGIAAREAAWREALDGTRLDDDEKAALSRSLSVKFRVTQGEIGTAVQHARTALDAAPDCTGRARALHEAVARVATPRLHQLAEAMPATHPLEDLVLPADRFELLNDVIRRVQHRRTVLEDWCFDAVSARGRGLVVLFHGASGTGKTMAADAIAHTLRMSLFRIDLAGVVSKYIGETEKNLRAIFDEADRADSVLFFDEADALFGKRSDVKDAHDRYANIEINYLLQRIESFDGIAILATNKRDHLDDAFLRRIHVSIEFPSPLVPERLRLWDRSFPAAAPLAPDIDWDFLARSFDLTGGAIRNAALGAAYLAAEARGAIGMREVLNAVRIELVKAGRRMPDSEFGPHAHLLARAAPAPQQARRPRTHDLCTTHEE